MGGSGGSMTFGDMAPFIIGAGRCRAGARSALVKDREQRAD
jgi:hypothetical protein